jgi:hypothetical protein
VIARLGITGVFFRSETPAVKDAQKVLLLDERSSKTPTNHHESGPSNIGTTL